ncbi:MAG: ATP-binding protein, partial [Oscillospiraceae bacterium]|nr:ATP-binding protein [Oscillospiraceae bacterium]
LYGDELRVKQILNNLLSNAFKYTKEGTVELGINCPREGEDVMINAYVRDTGIGIRPEDIDSLFYDYSQVNMQSNRKIVGTGLGLPIAKKMAEMMSGSITVESEYGVGTTFTLRIPYIKGSESEVSVHSRNNADINTRIFAPDARILVVDDNEFNLKVASGLFGLLKIETDTADSGMKAVDLVKKSDYDIIFMDHMMPEMDGVETTQVIRKLGGKYEQSDLPIIALTANAVLGAKEMFLENGFNDFVSKPIEVPKLNEVVRKWLPPEKIVTQTNQPDSNSESQVKSVSTFINAVSAIDMINAEVGLSRASGMENLYEESLALMHKSLVANCAKMSGDLSLGTDDGLKSFSITVHSMKSMLATVGAVSLSEIAAELETKSKATDSEFCNEKYPSFKEKLLLFKNSLDAVFPVSLVPDENSEKPKGDLVFLKEQIAAAFTAADDFDNEAGSAALESVTAYDYGEEFNQLLAEAVAAFNEFDCDAAAEKLKEIAV